MNMNVGLTIFILTLDLIMICFIIYIICDYIKRRRSESKAKKDNKFRSPYINDDSLDKFINISDLKVDQLAYTVSFADRNNICLLYKFENYESQIMKFKDGEIYHHNHETDEITIL